MEWNDPPHPLFFWEGQAAFLITVGQTFLSAGMATFTRQTGMSAPLFTCLSIFPME